MTHKEYPALRKIFLQWMFVERLVVLSKAQEFFQLITSSLDFGRDEDNEKDLNVFIDYCKKALNPISLSLKKQLFVQADKKTEYIGLCNMKSDNISQMATKLNAESIDQFKKIIDFSRKAPNHEFSSFDLEQHFKLSKTQVQSLINDLIECDWIFFSNSKGLFYLGPRTLLELGEYLKEQADESNDDDTLVNVFHDCLLCSSIISCGSKLLCGNNDCKLKYHHYCIIEYSKTTGKSECPKCQTPIDNSL